MRPNRYRTAITVPEKFLKQFSEQIREFADRVALAAEESVPEAAEASTTAANVPAAAAAAATTVPVVETKAAEPAK